MTTNSNRLTRHVILSNGHRVTIQVEPHEAVIDDAGYIRLFSIHFDDGTIGNFKLLQPNSTPRHVLENTKKFLIPFGIEAAGQYFTAKSVGKNHAPIVNLAAYLAKNYGPKAVGKVLDDVYDWWNVAHGEYYEVTTGELVITHPIKI